MVFFYLRKTGEKEGGVCLFHYSWHDCTSGIEHFSFGCLNNLYCVRTCWVRRCRIARGDPVKHWPQR